MSASGTSATQIQEARPHPDDTPRLSVEQASYAYSPTRRQIPTFTLGATSFQARQRELVAILGPNASGKSTLLQLIASKSARSTRARVRSASRWFSNTRRWCFPRAPENLCSRDVILMAARSISQMKKT
jgi:ABC-type molybdenum transport system ATPase subunit/photorepair protein PhrA